MFGPDETASNRLQALFEATERAWDAETIPEDTHLAPNGRVMEILSEHTCQGWLEGYLLTGRHGFFSCYEAFIHIVDSMFNQHAKWLKASREIAWRRPIASLNYLLTSHVWRQDHNGFSHQDPGFVDHVVNKKADIVRVYFPPDANTLLYVTDHCLEAGTASMSLSQASSLRRNGSTWTLPSNIAPKALAFGSGRAMIKATSRMSSWPAPAMFPTVETLAAVDLLHRHVPDLKVRVINVVDLMTLQPRSEHPHGLADNDFDALFTKDKPVIFAYHGYPWLIHRLAYRRTNHDNMHVRGYKEEGFDNDAFRHGRAQRARPLSSCRRRHRPGAGARRSGGFLRNKRSATSSSSTSAISPSTARICPKSRTGAGRTTLDPEESLTFG